MEITNVMFSGVGGQGTLTSGRLLALAAMQAGLDVKMSEVHGMSQRGGNVDTHVRLGKEVPSSLIPKGGADFLVSFEKLEALRYLDYLSPGGTAFVNKLELKPLAASLKAVSYVDDIDRVLEERAPNLVWVDAIPIAREVGDIRMVNVIMLGGLSTKLPLADEHWQGAIKERFRERFHGTCIEALQKGRDLMP